MAKESKKKPAKQKSLSVIHKAQCDRARKAGVAGPSYCPTTGKKKRK